MMAYSTFLVSTKIAIYNHDATKVMVMKYPHVYGLPDGHLERHETPEEALVRELDEELGVTLPAIKKADFFLRDTEGETVILGFTATAPAGFITHPSDYEKEHDVWVGRDEIAALDMAEGYKKMIFEEWPQTS